MAGSYATALRGSQLPQAKLNEELVRQMRAEYVYLSPTHGTPALAKKYGVSSGTAWNICSPSGMGWQHVARTPRTT